MFAWCICGYRHIFYQEFFLFGYLLFKLINIETYKIFLYLDGYIYTCWLVPNIGPSVMLPSLNDAHRNRSKCKHITISQSS